MGKVFKNRKCDVCGNVGTVIESWGKNYCRPCWDIKPKRGGGNSGMVYHEECEPEHFLIEGKGLSLLKVKKSHHLFVKWFIDHYPQSKGIVGRSLNYLIYFDGVPMGIIGANSPPLNFKKFVNFFKSDERSYLNNNAFRIVISNGDKNLGTKVLKLFRNTLKKDYKEKFDENLIGLVTFVEPPRVGSIYKADNWIYLGETEGKHCYRRGDHGKWVNKEWTQGSKKLIFARFL